MSLGRLLLPAKENRVVQHAEGIIAAGRRTPTPVPSSLSTALRGLRGDLSAEGEYVSVSLGDPSGAAPAASQNTWARWTDKNAWSKWYYKPLLGDEFLKRKDVYWVLFFFLALLPTVGTLITYAVANLGGLDNDSQAGNSTANCTGFGMPDQQRTFLNLSNSDLKPGVPLYHPNPLLRNLHLLQDSLCNNSAGDDPFAMLYSKMLWFFVVTSILVNLAFTFVPCYTNLMKSALKKESWSPYNLLLVLLAIVIGALAGGNYIPMLTIADDNIERRVPSLQTPAATELFRYDMLMAVGSMMQLNGVALYGIAFNQIPAIWNYFRERGLLSGLKETAKKDWVNYPIFAASIYMGCAIYWKLVAQYFVSKDVYGLGKFKDSLHDHPSLQAVLPIALAVLASVGDGAFGIFFAVAGLNYLRNGFKDMYAKIRDAQGGLMRAAVTLNLLFFLGSISFGAFGTMIPSLTQAGDDLGDKIAMGVTPVIYNAPAIGRLLAAMMSLFIFLNFQQFWYDLTLDFRDPAKTPEPRPKEFVEPGFNTQMPYAGFFDDNSYMRRFVLYLLSLCCSTRVDFVVSGSGRGSNRESLLEGNVFDQTAGEETMRMLEHGNLTVGVLSRLRNQVHAFDFGRSVAANAQREVLLERIDSVVSQQAQWEISAQLDLLSQLLCGLPNRDLKLFFVRVLTEAGFNVEAVDGKIVIASPNDFVSDYTQTTPFRAGAVAGAVYAPPQYRSRGVNV